MPPGPDAASAIFSLICRTSQSESGVSRRRTILRLSPFTISRSAQALPLVSSSRMSLPSLSKRNSKMLTFWQCNDSSNPKMILAAPFAASSRPVRSATKMAASMPSIIARKESTLSTVGNRLSVVACVATRPLILVLSCCSLRVAKIFPLRSVILPLGPRAVNGKSVPFAQLGKTLWTFANSRSHRTSPRHPLFPVNTIIISTLSGYIIVLTLACRMLTAY